MNITGKYFFGKPNFLEKPYGWVQHTPFAFYLIEMLRPEIFVELGTHSGNSYFSFCQAVYELKINTKCYAVDTWEGDEHASFYSTDVYERVKRINNQHFPQISYLLKMTFDNALEYFSDKSIDLLHIDGLHTYDAVKHDFESWLPKISSKGVIIMHDTNVRERGFGVWKFFEEIKNKYPSFEFLHGHGLGVVCVGKSIPSEFLKFVETTKKDPFIQHFFATLGNRILAIQEKEDVKEEVLSLKRSIRQSEKEVEKNAKQIEALKIYLENRKEKIAALELSLNKNKEYILKKNEKISSLEVKLNSFKESIAKRDEKISTLDAKVKEYKESNAKRNEKILTLEAKVNEYKESYAKRNERILKLEGKLEEFKEIISKRNDHVSTLEKKYGELKEEIAKRNNRIVLLEEKLLEKSELIVKKNEKISYQEIKIQEFIKILQIKNDLIASVRDNQVKQKNLIDQKDDKIQKLIDKLNKLNELLISEKSTKEKIEIERVKLNDKFVGVSNRLNDLSEEIKKYRELAKKRNEKLQEYKEVVERRNKKIVDLNRKIEEQRIVNKKLSTKIQAKDKEVRSILSSKSWRITKPLRFVGKIIRKIIFSYSFLIKLFLFGITFQIEKLRQELRILHYIKIIRNSKIFDSDWYLKQYPDIAITGINPIKHFVRRGVFEGRNPSPKFHTNAYLEHYDDVAQVGINPLVHYILYGKSEGRKAFDCINNEDRHKEPRALSLTTGQNQWKIEKGNQARDCILYVVHDGGGGMVYISFDMMKFMNNKGLSYILQVGTKEWNVFTTINNEIISVLKYKFNNHWNEIRDLNKERIEALSDLTNRLSPSIVHVRVLIGSGPGIIEFYSKKKIPVVFSFHDFSAVCPSIHLINNGKFCYGNCNLYSDEMDCKFSRNWFGKISRLRPDFRENWGRIVGPSLEKCQAYIVTSEFTKKIILENYTHLDINKFKLIEHGRIIDQIIDLCKIPEKGKNLDIVFFGALNEVKGIRLVLDLMRINNEKNGPIKLHVIGEVVGLLNEYQSCDNIFLYGKYEREQLQGYFKKIKPSITIIPSICHETFSHTLTESWMFGVPVIGTTYGAVGERIIREKGGWTLDPISPQEWYDKIISVLNDKIEFLEKKSNVNRINFKTIHQMIDEYYDLYQSIIKTKNDEKSIQNTEKKDHKVEPVKIKRLQTEREIKKIRIKLLEFGFSRAFTDLINIFNEKSNQYGQSLAGWELALWHANKENKEDAQRALEYISKISLNEFDVNFNQRLTLIEAECFEKLGNISKAKAVIANSLAIASNIDLVLASANLEVSLHQKLTIINRIYEQHGLSLITIDNQKTQSTYDSLMALSSEAKSISNTESPIKVTIIVPAFNAEETIGTTLNSLIAQTYSNIEIFVVDDCSTDNTIKIVREFEQKDKRIKLIESKINQGPYVARNLALQVAQGDYVTCNDSDDWSHPEKIAFQVKHLIENPDAIANISQWARVTPELRFYRRNNPGYYMQINLSSLMFRRKAVLDKLGYWDSVRYGADTELHKRLAIAFGAESIIELPPVPLSFARYSEASLTGNPVFGYPGFPMGSRKEYRDSYLHYYTKSKEIKYAFPLKKRPFPVPWIMDSLIDPKIVEQRHFNLVLVSDFRILDKNVDALIKDAKSKKKEKFKLGLVHMEIFDLVSKVKFDPNVRDLIDGDSVQMLVYGEKVTCDDLVVVHLKVLNEKQLFIPTIIPKCIKVVIDINPEEFDNDNLKEILSSCNDNLNTYFGDTSIWYSTDNQMLEILSTLIKSQNIPIVLSNSIWEHPITSCKWEKVPLNIKNQIIAIETIPEKKEQIVTIDDSILVVDIKNIEIFSYSNPNGVAIIMPCIDTQMGIDTAKFLLKRAGMECRIVIVNDTLRKGFINVLNTTARRMDVKYVVYLAQDAYPGLDWLKLAYDDLEKTGKGLLAFNCGKWRGRVAAFGMIRMSWIKGIYGDSVLYPDYNAHKADNEITVIARVLDSFVYNPNSTLVEIDKDKVFKENIPEDKELFRERFRTGFDGLLPLEKLKPLAEEYFVPWKDVEKTANAKDQDEEKQQSVNNKDDRFVLYRIIGNDLYPRHKKGQSRENLKFILENEPNFESCEKRFVVNRIIDKEEEQLIIQLLQKHNRQFLHIPFNIEEYQKIGYDTSCLPEPGYLASKEFQALDKNKQDRAIAAVYRLKNNYIMNNNGARNLALNDGLLRAKWILPWDGNCFLTEKAWKQIIDDIRLSPQKKYFVVPMTRVTNNEDLLKDNFIPDPVEEPQLIFRNDATEKFNEEFPYGRRPKVELLWRLGIPGKWDGYPKDDSWDLQRKPLSPDAGNFGYAGWVARLFSGNKEQEKDTSESIKQRVLARVDAIISTINHVDLSISDNIQNRLTSFNAANLDEEKDKFTKGESEDVRSLINLLVEYAEEALTRGPFSVIDKTTLPPSGNKNDYWHPAPYWWPNPDTKDGLPYIRKDGERVPGTRMYEIESDKYDRTRLQRVFDDSTILVLATKFSDDKKFARHAVKILQRFFIDPETRMNPHLMYGQVRMGHDKNQGTCTGIIETKDLYYYLDAIRLLIDYNLLTDRIVGNFKDWLNDLLQWLLNSPQGKAEVRASNNHGTCYDLQVASIASFINNQDVLFKTFTRAQSRIPQQFMPDGSQPHELDRTITAHYVCFNYQSWINLAEIASRYNVDLWEYECSNGAGLIKGAEWIVKHMGKAWPYKQIEEFDYDRFLPIFFAAEERARIKLNIKNFPKSKYKVKPIFFPHDGIRPFWNIG
jgi:glycosyltransferase involved in cell wall biosynthesis